MTSKQRGLSEKALDLIENAQAHHHPDNDPTPNTGPVDKDRPDVAPSGALDAEGHRPVLERSRKVR